MAIEIIEGVFLLQAWQISSVTVSWLSSHQSDLSRRHWRRSTMCYCLPPHVWSSSHWYNSSCIGTYWLESCGSSHEGSTRPKTMQIYYCGKLSGNASGICIHPPHFFLFDIFFWSETLLRNNRPLQYRSWTFDELGAYQVWFLARGDYQLCQAVFGWSLLARYHVTPIQWYRSLVCTVVKLTSLNGSFCMPYLGLWYCLRSLHSSPAHFHADMASSIDNSPNHHPHRHHL
jgi:hypothetical protein